MMKTKGKLSISGFSLIEVMFSIVIISVALIPLVGLIPMGLKNVQVSSEETHAIHLLTAVVQDLKFTKSSDAESYLFKLSQTPYREANEGVVNRVWIDRYWNVYKEKKTDGMYYELEWSYTKVPDKRSFLPIEGSFTVRWPPPLKSDPSIANGKSGEISALVVFKRRQT